MMLAGKIEMDETMFGSKISGKHARGAAGKRMIFWIYQRNGEVLTFPIASRGKQDLVPLMTHHSRLNCVLDSLIPSIKP